MEVLSFPFPMDSAVHSYGTDLRLRSYEFIEHHIVNDPLFDRLGE